MKDCWKILSLTKCPSKRKFSYLVIWTDLSKWLRLRNFQHLLCSHLTLSTSWHHHNGLTYFRLSLLLEHLGKINLQILKQSTQILHWSQAVGSGKFPDSELCVCVWGGVLESNTGPRLESGDGKQCRSPIGWGWKAAQIPCK